MNITPRIVSLICLSTFGAFAGMAQTLTCTFQFTGSGTLGTHAFTNAATTITTISNAVNPQTNSSGNLTTLNNTSASITVSGIGTFQFTMPTAIYVAPSPPNTAPGTSFDESLSFGYSSNPFLAQLHRTVTNEWNMTSSLGPITTTGAGSLSAWNISFSDYCVKVTAWLRVFCRSTRWTLKPRGTKS